MHRRHDEAGGGFEFVGFEAGEDVEKQLYGSCRTR